MTQKFIEVVTFSVVVNTAKQFQAFQYAFKYQFCRVAFNAVHKNVHQLQEKNNYYSKDIIYFVSNGISWPEFFLLLYKYNEVKDNT